MVFSNLEFSWTLLSENQNIFQFSIVTWFIVIQFSCSLVTQPFCCGLVSVPTVYFRNSFAAVASGCSVSFMLSLISRICFQYCLLFLIGLDPISIFCDFPFLNQICFGLFLPFELFSLLRGSYPLSVVPLHCVLIYFPFLNCYAYPRHSHFPTNFCRSLSHWSVTTFAPVWIRLINSVIFSIGIYFNNLSIFLFLVYQKIKEITTKEKAVFS